MACAADNAVSLAELQASLAELRIHAEPGEVRQLFESLDTDGSGSIDIGELRAAYDAMVRAARQLVAEVGAQKAALASKRARARELQRIVRDGVDEDKLRIEAAEEGARMQEVARAKERTEAKAAARLAKDEKERTAAAEKAAANARVEERRNKAKSNSQQ